MSGDIITSWNPSPEVLQKIPDLSDSPEMHQNIQAILNIKNLNRHIGFQDSLGAFYFLNKRFANAKIYFSKARLLAAAVSITSKSTKLQSIKETLCMISQFQEAHLSSKAAELLNRSMPLISMLPPLFPDISITEIARFVAKNYEEISNGCIPTFDELYQYMITIVRYQE